MVTNQKLPRWYKKGGISDPTFLDTFVQGVPVPVPWESLQTEHFEDSLEEHCSWRCGGVMERWAGSSEVAVGQDSDCASRSRRRGAYG